jgi:lactoylglutathione lyase
MKKPGIPVNLNDREEKQHQGIIHISFGVETMEMVTGKSKELSEAGYRILRGPRKTGDGYFEFETLDPDNNRIEVAARFVE